MRVRKNVNFVLPPQQNTALAVLVTIKWQRQIPRHKGHKGAVRHNKVAKLSIPNRQVSTSLKRMKPSRMLRIFCLGFDPYPPRSP